MKRKLIATIFATDLSLKMIPEQAFYERKVEIVKLK